MDKFKLIFKGNGMHVYTDSKKIRKIYDEMSYMRDDNWSIAKLTSSHLLLTHKTGARSMMSSDNDLYIGLVRVLKEIELEEAIDETLNS